MERGSITGPYRTAFAFAVFGVLLYFLFKLQDILLLSFFALLIGILLDGFAGLLAHYLRLRHGIAVVSAAFLFVGAVSAILVFLTIPIVKEGNEFVRSLPEQISKLEQRFETFRASSPLIKRYLPPLPGEDEKGLPVDSSKVVKNAVNTVSGAFDWGATALATFFLGLFLAWNPDRWVRGVAEIWPGGSVKEHLRLLRKIGAALRSYLVSVGIYMVAMAVLWTLGLWAIGMKYSLLFGAIGGLVEIVPYVGPLLGLIPPLVMALTMGTKEVIFVLGLYALLHVVEGYLIVPYLMNRREHLPQPIVVFSILAGGALFGMLGVILAVPLGTVVYVCVTEHVYHSKRSDA